MRRLVVVSAIVVAVAAIVFAAMRMGQGDTARSSSGMPLRSAQETVAQSSQGGSPLPFTFFLTHYELLGDPSNPNGVVYHSNGHPFAEAPDGSRLTLSGHGSWDPITSRAEGGGGYTIMNATGAITAQGTWEATIFISFEQLPGWWGIPGFVERGWQGPPGSASFAGFLKVEVTLSDQGTGVLTAWCLMATTPMPDGHVSDGISLTGGDFRYTNSTKSEQTLEGVMFYGP